MAKAQLAEWEKVEGVLEVADSKDDIDENKDPTAELEADDVTQQAVANKKGERFEAGKISRKDLDATKLYLKDIEKSELLTADEEKYYGRLVQKGDQKARARMIECNLRLVVKISRRYMNRGLALLDLIEEGNLGLIHAVKKFDPERGFRFSTYATWWIRQTIERAIMNQTRTIRLPIHILKEMNVYIKASRRLEQTLGYEPTEEEIAKLLDCPVGNVKRLMKLRDRVTSVDKPVSKDGENPLLDIIPDETNLGPSMDLQRLNMEKSLDGLLGELETSQCEVVVRRFGLRGHERSTLEEVGTEMGVTRERVRQIQMEALKRLRRIMESKGLFHRELFSYA